MAPKSMCLTFGEGVVTENQVGKCKRHMCKKIGGGTSLAVQSHKNQISVL